MKASEFFFGSSEEDNESCFPSLTYKERIIGFLVCFAIGKSYLNSIFQGILLQFLSFGSLIGVMVGSPTRFAIIFTFGNIFSLIGTAFLIGPIRQIKQMAHDNRKYTSIIYISSMIMVFLSALVFHSKGLVFIFLIIELCAYVWYMASYIPFARSCILGCLNKVIQQ